MFRPAVKALLVLTAHHWLKRSQPPQTKHTTYQVRGRVHTLPWSAPSRGPSCSWYAAQAVARSARPGPIRPPIGCCTADVTHSRGRHLFGFVSHFVPAGFSHALPSSRVVLGACLLSPLTKNVVTQQEVMNKNCFIHFQWYKSRWVQWSEWGALFL